MPRNLEKITQDYWEVSYEVKVPGTAILSVKEALDILRSADQLRPTDRKLASHMHVIAYDIIEGNQEWREEHQGAGLLLTLPMRD